MSILIPAIQGRFGNTDYYQATMKARDLVQGVRPPSELDEWKDFGIEERMQRDPMMARIKKELAPYLARNADRFFGSIIVLVYKGDVAFESVTAFVKEVPNAYKKNAQRVGFLTIDGGTLIVLDGQHRLLAERMVLQQEVKGPESATVGDDEICVIFIKHENNIKTRRIFNTVNRYAKPTSRGDNIITSEDDAYAIVARRLLSDNQPLRAVPVGGKLEDVVNWKSNTLSARSTSLTTISVVYETVRLILSNDDIDKQERPEEEALEEYLHRSAVYWGALLSKVTAYATALSDPSSIPSMREDTASTSLLFKPAAQIALFNALLSVSNSGLSFEDAAARVDKISDWSMTSPTWKDIIIKSGGSMDNKADATERLAMLLTYLLAADKLSKDRQLAVWRMYNQARHPDAMQNFEATNKGSGLEPLPAPVAGEQFTVEDALAAIESSLAKS